MLICSTRSFYQFRKSLCDLENKILICEKNVHNTRKIQFATKSSLLMFFYLKTLLLRPYSHETFWHTIYKDIDIFKEYNSIPNQGKLLSKSNTWYTRFWKSSPWLVNINLLLKIAKCRNIILSHYCVPKCLARIRPDTNRLCS
jgi:hypothetical protein